MVLPADFFIKCVLDMPNSGRCGQWLSYSMLDEVLTLRVDDEIKAEDTFELQG